MNINILDLKTADLVVRDNFNTVCGQGDNKQDPLYTNYSAQYSYNYKNKTQYFRSEH